MMGRWILMLLLNFIVASWKGEIKLLDFTGYGLEVWDMFSPKENIKSTHILYGINSGDNKGIVLHHAIISPQLKKIESQTVISTNAIQAKIAGSMDGKKLFVTYAKKNESLSEVYFIESENGGNSWSEPMKIGPLDKFGRDHPNILYNEEMGRIWIFYFRSDTNVKKKWIEFVTRPQGSHIFSRDYRVHYITSTSQHLDPAITKSSESTWTLHIQYVDESEDLSSNSYYSFSKNNGISWSLPIIMDTKVMYMSVSLVSHFSSETPVLVSSGSNFTHTQWLLSQDGGKSWKQQDAVKKFYYQHSADLCEGKSPSNLYYFFLGLEAVPSFFYFSPGQTEGIVQGPDPFKKSSKEKIQNLSVLSCAIQDPSTIVVNAVAVRRMGSIHSLVFNQYEMVHSQTIMKQ